MGRWEKDERYWGRERSELGIRGREEERNRGRDGGGDKGMEEGREEEGKKERVCESLTLRSFNCREKSSLSAASKPLHFCRRSSISSLKESYLIGDDDMTISS